jgi:hypothetical protein
MQRSLCVWYNENALPTKDKNDGDLMQFSALNWQAYSLWAGRRSRAALPDSSRGIKLEMGYVGLNDIQ